MHAVRFVLATGTYTARLSGSHSDVMRRAAAVARHIDAVSYSIVSVL
jgi:hypothetical protein